MYLDYAQYLKNRYQQKVYKLPLHIPVTCPNRDGSLGKEGCVFCSSQGVAYELQDALVPIKDQLLKNKDHISKKYKAKAFIAYFQNYSNTYLPLDQMMHYVREAAIEGVVEICLSTRPDCLPQEKVIALAEFQRETGIQISIELGLQTTNDATLIKINRGHDVKCFVDAVKRLKAHDILVGVHLIPNLPWDSPEDCVKTAQLMTQLRVDTLKFHALYIMRGTQMAKWYQEGTITMGTYEDYFDRICLMLPYLSKDIGIQRFFGRAPEEETLFCNWGRSWRFLKDQLDQHILLTHTVQGSRLE